MITSIPSNEDFQSRGSDYLNLAWGQLLSLILDFEDSEDWGGERTEEEYVDFAEREIDVAVSLAAQGAEFLLKSKIAEVSPWLLISREPRDWPKGCDKNDISFSEFRTIDAQDLVKVHNTFCQTKLDEEFATQLKKIREARNSIVHTVATSSDLGVVEILEQILLISEFLIGPRQWISRRRAFLDSDRHSSMMPDIDEYRLVREFSHMPRLLERGTLERHFGFLKKQRPYLCPRCYRACSELTLEPFIAQLQPNKSNGTSLYCFVCDCLHDVVRAECNKESCLGNVIDRRNDCCLSCGAYQS